MFLFYLCLKDVDQIDDLEFINSLINSNSEYTYIVVLVEGLEGSSKIYKQINYKLNCPVVSVLGYLPDAFYPIGMANYPSAIFIKKGIYTGIYSNIESISKFNDALDLFLSDSCLALIKNN